MLHYRWEEGQRRLHLGHRTNRRHGQCLGAPAEHRRDRIRPGGAPQGRGGCGGVPPPQNQGRVYLLLCHPQRGQWVLGMNIISDMVCS